MHLRGYCRSDALKKRIIIATRNRCCGRKAPPPFERSDNAGLAKLLRAARVRSAKLTEALQKAEAISRELEDMPFRSRLKLVTCLVGSAVAQQIESPPK